MTDRASRLEWSRWLLAAAIFGPTMAIGGVHVTVLAITAFVLAAAAGLAWFGAEPLRVRRCASLVLWTAVLLTLWTALSVVPLPAVWLERLSPHAADVWSRCLGPLGRAGPAWATLSLDPGASRVQILRGVVYALAFLTASRIAARREGAVFLERAILVTGLALAVAALLHPALGLEKVFGVYSPRTDPGPRHIAPILNANVLSGYLNISLAIAVGQVMAPRTFWPRSVLAALAAALVGVQVWVASRGGVTGAIVGIALVVWMSRSKAAARRRGGLSLIVPGVLMCAGIAMAVVASSREAMGELADFELSKLDLAREALRMTRVFPVFGVGRGAFESVFPAFRTDVGIVTYTHPENIVAQWATEWGIPMAALAFVALAVALRPSSAMARSPRAAGAWGALVCVAIQNLVDFGSEYPALGIAVCSCAAIVTGGTSGLDEPRKLDVWARRPTALAVVAGLAALLALCCVLPGWNHELFADRMALRASALDPSVGRAQFEREAEAVMLRHPAEPFLPFVGALRAVRAGDSSLVPWVARTFERAAVYGPAHLLLARWLTPRSPSQARLEYRSTLEQAPELWTYVAPAVASLIHDYDDATELIPNGPGKVNWINILATTVDSRLPATSRRLDELLRQLGPDDPELAERAANDALRDAISAAETPWCAGERRASCLKDGLERADRLIRVAPARCAGHAIRARLLLEQGEPARALRELRAAADTVGDRTACLEQLANLGTLANSEEAVTYALDRVAHAGCADDSECVRNLEFVAYREIARRNERSALAALKRARTKAPADDALLERIAALAAKLDLHAESLLAYQSLAQRHPDDPRWSAAVAAEKLALVTGAIPR